SGLVRLLVLLGSNFSMDFFHVHSLDLFDQIVQLGSGKGTGLREQQDVLTEDHQGRNGANTQASGQFLLFFRVHLAKGHAGVLGRSCVKDRGELATWTAPRSPEVDDQGFAVFYCSLECFFVQFDDAHGGASAIKKRLMVFSRFVKHAISVLVFQAALKRQTSLLKGFSFRSDCVLDHKQDGDNQCGQVDTAPAAGCQLQDHVADKTKGQTV